MPRFTPRQTRARRLVTAYMQFRKWYLKRLARRRLFSQSIRQLVASDSDTSFHLDQPSNYGTAWFNQMDTSSSSSTSSAMSTVDILGGSGSSDSKSASDSTTSTTSTTSGSTTSTDHSHLSRCSSSSASLSSDAATDPHSLLNQIRVDLRVQTALLSAQREVWARELELLQQNDFLASSDTDSDSSSDSSEEDGNDADIEDSVDQLDSDSDSDSDPDSLASDSETPPLFLPRISRSVSRSLFGMYQHRYEKRRVRFPRGPPFLPHLLNVLKTERPDHFRQELRIDPTTFDQLVHNISTDPIFTNNSQNDQMPIQHQVAITLYRFGHYGNAAGLDKVAKWSGYAKGTILLATRRVMTAILRQSFLSSVLCLPTAEEKEKAKRWVERHSCEWCMVDGTLIPLYTRPYWYGESYYDRKNNYSLNLQVISLPDLRIVDVSYGCTGSTHDSSAFEDTRFFQEHETILEGQEFMWADSAYPIETWLVAPYKKPEKNLPQNETFNKHLSAIRIRSEHAIGFLKGRFQSLKSLRLNIHDESTHKFATYWVLACVVLHSFAIKSERADGSSDSDLDPFVNEGLSSSGEDRDGNIPFLHQNATRNSRLAAAKARRESLKAAIFQARGYDSDGD